MSSAGDAMSALRRASLAMSSSSRGDGGADDAHDDPFEEHAPVEIAPKELDLGSGGVDEKLPNTLVVTVIQAHGLPPAPLRSTLSCYVKLASLGREYKTSVITKSDGEPCWNESFSFRAADWASSVTLSVRDKINVKVRVLGHVQISSADIANMPGMVCQDWFKLRDKSGSGATVGDAELELKVALVYTARNDPSVPMDVAAAAAEQDDDIMGIVADQEDETEAEVYARRRELERQERERKSTLYANLKQGDYQIQVHVIEARDLKGENLSGTSDPYCQVEVLGVTKRTSTKYETLGCVFDEILFFHFTNIGRNELRQATIKIGVWDKEKVLKDNFIGAYQLDCLSVYFRPHHELYRQWIAIHDHVSAKDRGIQGFVLVSINVIGPGDSFLVHDRDAELAKELAASASLPPQDAASNIDTSHSIVLLPPTIDLKLHFLLVKVFRAEDLPAMDNGGFGLASGIDAFIQIGFAANAACRSSVVTVKGSGHLAPEFLEELWIPVLSPTLSRHIAISVWDRDLGRKDELVGIASHDYQQVRSASSPGGVLAPGDSSSSTTVRDPTGADGDSAAAIDDERVELRWYNLYGPPLRRVNKKRAALALQHPELGSTYRGRVLLSMERVEAPMPSESEKFHVKRMTDATVSASVAPRTVKYALRCALFCGAGIPQAQSALSSTKKTKMRVTLSIGPCDVHFDAQPVARDGSVSWEQYKERWPIMLPADVTQLPDVVVTLSRQVDKDDFVGVAFARVAAADVFAKGFTAACEWIHLREDVARRQTKFALDKTQTPGSVLLRLGFGREELAVRHPWGDDVALFAPFKTGLVHREVRVHIFQLRKLVPSAMRTRLPNPFVSVTCCGQRKKLAPKYKTLDPLFYESVVFTVYAPHDLAYSPDIVVQVHDANISTSAAPAIPSNVLGELVLSMSAASKTAVNASAPRPEWHALQPQRSSDSDASVSGTSAMAFIDEAKGDALVSLQVVDHSGPIEHLHPLEPLAPKYEDATLEITALGVRRLKALSVISGVQRPFLEFELLGGVFADGTSVRTSKPSVASASAKNANFLDFLVCPVKLPVDTLFAPQLRVKVCERALGGLRKATLASCVVDLAPKLPWSASYIQPPTQRAFENPASAPAFAAASVPSPANTGKPKRKTKKRVRFPGLKIAAQRRAMSVNPRSVDAVSDEDDALLSGDDRGSNAFDGDGDDGDGDVEEDVLTDDGIGIGELALPRISFASSGGTKYQCIADPAVRQRLETGTQRRYLAAQNDLLGRSSGSGDDTHNALHDSHKDADATLKPAPYMAGRDWWITDHGGEELEHFLKTPALETYALYRSVLTRPSLLRRTRVRTELRAGLFKGLIAVRERSKRASASRASSLLDLERLQEPQAVVARVYVLRGSNLQSKDANGYSDPYLRLKLGKHVISDRAHYKPKTLSPDFYAMFEFTTTLPGPSQLEIGVWDHDIVSDDFIGATTIDLEDRWFHRDWQRIGHGHPKLQDAGGCLKPIEYRHLYTPKRTTSQGFLQLWVDILTAQQAAVLPPVNIAPPAPKKFEVRVVLWRGENITDKDGSEMNDYFVKVWMEGGSVESSDVHWRCSSGKPCWNWRFKLPVEYPLRTAEFGRLHIQLWDKDVLKWNDMVGEAQLDLYKWLRRAYATGRTVAPFEELKTMASAETHGMTSTRDHHIQVQNGDSTSDGASKLRVEDASGDSSDGEDADDDGDSASDDGSRAPTGARESHALLRNQPKHKRKMKVPGKPSLKAPTFRTKPSAESTKKAKEAKAQAEAKAALNGLLDFLGLGDLPDDAEWITMHYTDRESGVSMNMGRLGVSVQIVPEQEALANPVGKGQDAPNMNPYLPPPVGRMRLSANPFLMLRELIGPKVCLRLTILCCCAGCVFFIAVFGATVMSTLTYFQGRSETDDDDGLQWQLPSGLRLPPLPGFQDPRLNRSTTTTTTDGQ